MGLVSVINAQRVDRAKKRMTVRNEVLQSMKPEKIKRTKRYKDLDRNECKGEADEEEKKTSLLEDMLPFYLSLPWKPSHPCHPLSRQID